MEKKIRYSRRLILAAAIIASLGVGAIGVGTTLAAQPQIENHMNGLVEAIAEEFNLKVADVQAVFDEQRQQMETDREAKETERLAQDVTDGKITQEQADAIVAKREEKKSFRETLASLDEATRQETMKTKMDEFKQWVKDNNLPKNYFPFGQRGINHRGQGFKQGPGPEGFLPIEDEQEVED